MAGRAYPPARAAASMSRYFWWVEMGMRFTFYVLRLTEGSEQQGPVGRAHLREQNAQVGRQTVVDSPSAPFGDRFGLVSQSPGPPVSPRKPRSRILRGVYLVLGLICLVFLAFSWLPGIPTFDLVILAAFFFSMSSDRLHGWLVNHPVYGKMIKGYRDYGLTMRMKWVAAIAITASLALSAFVLLNGTVIRVILAAVWVFAVWFVFTRPTRAKDPLDQPPLTA
jgi:uncharacterized membrane protein YbaN (DUF454 family)